MLCDSDEEWLVDVDWSAPICLLFSYVPTMTYDDVIMKHILLHGTFADERTFTLSAGVSECACGTQITQKGPFVAGMGLRKQPSREGGDQRRSMLQGCLWSQHHHQHKHPSIARSLPPPAQ